jgi:Mn-dependent DtxR family transcriptional regulator
MDYEEAKEKIVSGMQKKKSKTKFYFNDLAKMLDLKPRVAKKLINRLVQEEVLEYWSSGSTSLYGIKGAGKQAHAEHED